MIFFPDGRFLRVVGAKITSSPCDTRMGSCTSPVRISHPWVSMRMTTQQPYFSLSSWMLLTVARWSSLDPCEKLSLATFMPAFTSSRSCSRVEHAGPMVQTIFVSRLLFESIRFTCEVCHKAHTKL